MIKVARTLQPKKSARIIQKPELFGDIVKAAIALLELLIAKVMQRVIEKAISM